MKELSLKKIAEQSNLRIEMYDYFNLEYEERQVIELMFKRAMARLVSKKIEKKDPKEEIIHLMKNL